MLYGEAFLNAIDQALAVLPKNRPQSVAALRALMNAAPTLRPEPAPAVADSQADIDLDLPDAPALAPAPAPAPARAARTANRRGAVAAGAPCALFALGYGLSRIAVEFAREPDAQIGYFGGWITMGMILSLPLCAVGVWLLLRSRRDAA